MASRDGSMELILLVSRGPKKQTCAVHAEKNTHANDASIEGAMLAQMGIGSSHAETPESIYRPKNIQ